jgi:DNA-binding GntR family transcriptional regulator
MTISAGCCYACIELWPDIVLRPQLDRLTVTIRKAYYQIVRELLASNIKAGTLPRGTRLFVAAVADRLAVSRSPVKRALELLAQEGLVRQDAALGYVVGNDADANAGTVRPNLHLLDLHLPGNSSEALVVPRWELILGTVERDLLHAIPFGIYQISETGLCDHFNVSRTVTREVLARLHERGVISKDRASHWIAGPLSARMLDHLHDIRQIVEPAALGQVVGMLVPDVIKAMRARADRALESGQTLSEGELARIEADLHETCLAPLRNPRMMQVVRNSQLSFVVNQLFATHVVRHDETAMLLEHRLVLDHLAIGDGAGAAAAMRHHLDADHLRTRERLKVLAIFGDPGQAPYLVRLV